MISITISQATPFAGQKPGKKPRTPKQIGQAIRYSLTNKPDEWKAIGADPGSIKYGINDEYTETIAQVMGWPSPGKIISVTEGKRDIAIAAVKAAEDVALEVREVGKRIANEELKDGGIVTKENKDDNSEVIIFREESKSKMPKARRPPPPPPKMRMTRSDGVAVEDKPELSLSESLSSKKMKKVILWTVLAADFVATFVNYWTNFVDKPDEIRIFLSCVFGFVAIIVALAGFVNYIKVKDEQTANAYAFFFGVYQLTIHVVTLLPNYSYVGCVAVIIGLVLVPSAVLTVVREESQ